ncbi:hypothetical protein SPI_04648 [Niveomyces insectorum RCEF 264]|uniref:MARVEL domain-containing protein n=1 Tax=Niveomyces insectorum RCEF 264 TaxID=1081102 RepID=A0A167UPY7_9HYPO|nr:hypothetical protein SPI_04648 [Niveomyces insectorum RCEF 264]
MASNTYASPVNGDSGTPGAYPVFAMPAGVMVARGFQLFLALVIMVLSGLLMHGYVLSAIAYALVCGLFTFIVALYAILSEKVPACRAGYNYWAVLSLDMFMAIFWLASMGAVAALRATFRYTTHATCYDNGSALNADTCITYKRDARTGAVLAKRDAVAGSGALAEMSAIAGLSALEMLLFIASFAYLAHQLRMHSRNQNGGVASNDAAVVEMKGQVQPEVQPVVDPTQAYGNAPVDYGYQPQPYGAGPGQPQASPYGYPQQSRTNTPAVPVPSAYAYPPQSQTPEPLAYQPATVGQVPPQNYYQYPQQ